jgi:hypothetical protein
MHSSITIRACLVAAICISASTGGSLAQEAQSHQLTVLIGTAPGGSFDLVGRVVSRTMQKHIPGNPTIVPQNMPGAGSMIAANYLYGVAPQDGSVVGVINPALAFNQLFGNKSAHFEVAKFNWIGSPTESLIVIPSWHTSAIKKWQDAVTSPAVMGAPVQTSPDAMSIYLINRALGTKFTVVTGYKGGSELDLAMERGEVIGRGGQSWSGLKAVHPEWIAEKKITPLLQIGLHSAPELKDVPLLSDIVSDPKMKEVVQFYSAMTAIGRPLVMGPNVPSDVAAMMRKAFADTMNRSRFPFRCQKGTSRRYSHPRNRYSEDDGAFRLSVAGVDRLGERCPQQAKLNKPIQRSKPFGFSRRASFSSTRVGEEVDAEIRLRCRSGLAATALAA